MQKQNTDRIVSSKYGRRPPTTIDTKLLLDAAIDRGITVRSLDRTKVYELTLRDHVEYVNAEWHSGLSAAAFSFTSRKHITKKFLKRAGVSVSAGKGVMSLKGATEWAEQHGFPLVMKPVRGIHGSSVHVGVSSMAELGQVYERIKQETGKNILIEEMFVGTEYRLFATRDRFLAATNRVPANVVGDVVRTIEQLIEMKNADPNRVSKKGGYMRPLFHIEIDAPLKQYLEKHGKTIEDVPAKDEHVQLRGNSNLSTGGDSIDVTDEVHQSVKDIAVRAVRAIPGLPYAGLDFMTRDVTAPQDDKTYIVIELNASPMLSMHHFPARGQGRDVAGPIIDDLFPEVAKS